MTADLATKRDHWGYELAGGLVDECVEWCPGCHDEGCPAGPGDCDYCDNPSLIAVELARAEAAEAAVSRSPEGGATDGDA